MPLLQWNTSEHLEIMRDVNNLWVRIAFPLALAITIANSIALAVFLKKTFLAKKSNYLLVNLTIADLLVGVTGIVHSTYLVSVNQPKTLQSSRMIMIFIAVTTTFSNASIMTLSLLALERLFAVFWPFHHRFSRKIHYFVSIAVGWFVTVSDSVPIFLIIVFPNYFSIIYSSCLLRCTVLLPLGALATIVVSYLSIWIKQKFFTKFRHCRTIQENSKLTKTLFIVTLVSLATWLPKATTDNINLMNVHKTPYINNDPALYTGLTVLLLSNSFFNLVVYAFRMPEFKKELRKTFCKCN